MSSSSFSALLVELDDSTTPTKRQKFDSIDPKERLTANWDQFLDIFEKKNIDPVYAMEITTNWTTTISKSYSIDIIDWMLETARFAEVWQVKDALMELKRRFLEIQKISY